MTFADRVRALRLSKGITQQQLATDSGIATRTLARLELGEGGVQLTTAAKLAEALGVPLADLVDEPAEAAS
jgi:transcriptional regulator with XRE-family HTH domain